MNVDADTKPELGDVSRVSGRDDELMARMIEAHGDWIRARLRQSMGAKLQGKEQTADLYQEALIKAVEYLPQADFSEPRQVRALLTKLVDNVLRDKARRYSTKRRDVGREQGGELQLNDVASKQTEATPSAIVSSHESSARLQHCLDELDSAHREVIVMREWEKLTFEQMSERLGLSIIGTRKRFEVAMMELSRLVRAQLRKDYSTIIRRS